MIASSFYLEDACAIAQQVRSRKLSATDAALAAIERIERFNPPLNCFTAVLRDRALSQARDLDRRIAFGDDPGPLAGVPFAVKNLFDIAGIATLAGSKINAERPPATRDATVIERFKQAGAILMGALNMDEYAYGFTTENTHFGVTRNPHDLQRVAGGSSGGSASAVAAGMVPLTLGSDTNGSIRVPAAFCGVFGLKPTYGAISRAGAFLFVPSLDHIGLLTRSVRDLALAFDLLRGPDPRDPVVSDAPQRACAPELGKGIDGLRIAVAEGYFASQGLPEAFGAVAKAAHSLRVSRTVTIPDAEKARAAADLITPCESANLHLDDLRSRPQDFDPAVVERFLTGALLPAAWYLQAQRFRAVFREKMRQLFETVDVILAPTTPCPAIRFGQPATAVDGLGRFTEPLSFIGLPVVSVPVFEPGQLPLGVQVIGTPHNESAVLRVAAQLEALGVARAPVVLEITY
jgi:AtzE family amidohydrolase